MAKADLIEMEKLCYDGSTPPKKFIKMFKIQAAFIDWDETAMAKNIPLFLEKRAMDVYEKSPSKTDIDVIFKELDEKCGPTANQYMAMFYARRKAPNETMMQFGKALEEMLHGGMPGVTDDKLMPLLKMQLNSTAPELTKVLVNFNKDLGWTEMLEGLDRAYPGSDILSPIFGHNESTVPSVKMEKAALNYTHGSDQDSYCNMTQNNSFNSGTNRGNRNGAKNFSGCFVCGNLNHRAFECPNRNTNGNNQPFRSNNMQQNQYSNNQRGNNLQNRGGQQPYQQQQFQQNQQQNNQHQQNNHRQQQQQQHYQQNRPQGNINNGNWRENINNRNTVNNNGGRAQFNNTNTSEPFNSTSYEEEDDRNSTYSMPSTISSNSTRVTNNNVNKCSNDGNEYQSDFPWMVTSQYTISNNNMAETIIVSNNATGSMIAPDMELLVTKVFAQIFDNKPRELNCLIDGGSTHSFISPFALATKYWDEIKEKKSDYDFKDFKIIGATGAVNSKCCIATCNFELGNWSGQHQFVISDRVTRYDMVLGRDFLKPHGAVIDHGRDIITLDGNMVKINNIETITIEEEHKATLSVEQIVLNNCGIGDCDNQLENKLKEVDCLVIGNHILKPNSHKLVEFQFNNSSFTKDALLSFEGRIITNYGCLVAKSVHCAGETRFYCNIMNTSNRQVRIKDSGLVGHVMECELANETEIKINSKEVNVNLLNDKEHAKRLHNINSLSIGSNLTSDQKLSLKAVLYNHHDKFAWGDSVLGRTNLVEHRVPTGDNRPVEQYQYPIPSVAREAMRDQVQDMLDKNIIRDSSSSWCSPVLLIKKTLDDGSIKYRFCIDLRRVNDLTSKDCYSLPRIDETVDALCGSMFFSSMDIDRAFWQVVMADEDRQKFAFRVDGRLLEPNVMPFGSKNAPATFQRLMDKVLRGLNWKQCLVYIDDILVFGRTFDEHSQRLDAVLNRIGAAGLLLKPSKSNILVLKYQARA